MTGERDPLVDDTVIFSGRLARAKEAAARHRSSPTSPGVDFTEELRDLGTAEVMLIPGTSHGFMQFPALYPPAWKHFQRCAEWFDQLYAHADAVRSRSVRRRRPLPVPLYPGAGHGARPQTAESSGDEDRPLEMSMLSRGRNASTTAATAVSDAQPEENNKTAGPRAQPKENGKRRGGMRMNKSLVKLASEEDLLSRRMHGLTSGLTGKGDDY
jgi:hypothetical protein